MAVVLVVGAAPAMTAPAFALGVDSGEDRAGLQVHDDALVEQLVDDEDDPAHILDQALPLDAFPKDAIEALVHAVEQLAQNQLIVVYMPNDKDGHVRIASEYSHIVVHCHNIVLEAIGGATRRRPSCRTRALLRTLQKQLTFKCFLLSGCFEWCWCTAAIRDIIVFGDDAIALVVEQNATLDVPHAALHYPTN